MVFIFGQGGFNSHTVRCYRIAWRGQDRHWGTARDSGVGSWCRSLPAKQNPCIDRVIAAIGEVPSHHDALWCMVVSGSGNSAMAMRSSVTTEQSS